MKFLGYFENPMGFELKKVPASDLYLFRLDAKKPLQFHLISGQIVQPDKKMLTDMASVPRCFQWLPSMAKDSFLAPYFHDSAYKNHGIYVDGQKVAMTRKEADEMLRDMIHAEGGKTACWIYYAGVRCFGIWSWKK